ncbi:hypothetical protein SprV_0602123200 [Sparganum proliferum]
MVFACSREEVRSKAGILSCIPPPFEEEEKEEEEDEEEEEEEEEEEGLNQCNFCSAGHLVLELKESPISQGLNVQGGLPF